MKWLGQGFKLGKPFTRYQDLPGLPDIAQAHNRITCSGLIRRCHRRRSLVSLLLMSSSNPLNKSGSSLSSPKVISSPLLTSSVNLLNNGSVYGPLPWRINNKTWERYSFHGFEYLEVPPVIPNSKVDVGVGLSWGAKPSGRL
ncbi:hypothetical protein PIB30_102002 [Stylosanthes scabra]|uniref:Uncharacterized protein n=1 Tax=Stylosanthes scabra TaxID=79078 RepID=A0ABU6TX15_9FABA|nr:hypothetical protein [Stylosanthes scabra]